MSPHGFRARLKLHLRHAAPFAAPFAARDLEAASYHVDEGRDLLLPVRRRPV